MADALNLDPAAVAREAVAAFLKEFGGRAYASDGMLATIRAGERDDALTCVKFAILGAKAMREAVAAEIVRRLDERNSLLVALREVRDAIEKADPAVLVCTLWMPGAAAETVIDRIDHALAAAEGRADG